MFVPPQQQQQFFLENSSAIVVQKRRQTSSSPSTSPIVLKANPKIQKCICERQMALVICRRCGNDLIGRVLSPCPTHPRRIALMDLRECPNCRSVQLSEIA